jgi:hypothetical protein
MTVVLDLSLDSMRIKTKSKQQECFVSGMRSLENRMTKNYIAYTILEKMIIYGNIVLKV